MNIGKAYSGLTDVEIAAMTEHFKATTLETHGPVHLVEPTVVLEIAFDQIQESKRHKSGYALRFPRIVRIRDDKTPDQISTIDEVRRIYEGQLRAGSKGRSQGHAPLSLTQYTASSRGSAAVSPNGWAGARPGSGCSLCSLDAFSAFPGVIVYIILWMVMPKAPYDGRFAMIPRQCPLPTGRQFIAAPPRKLVLPAGSRSARPDDRAVHDRLRDLR